MHNSADSPAPDLPLMLFDGKCGVCRVAVDRWQQATGNRIRYLPYQEARSRVPQISERDLGRAVTFIDTDGAIARGAHAVFRAMAHCDRKRWLLWLYERLPPVAFVAELVYRLYAANRKPISLVRRIWWGKDLEQPTYHIASALFLRFLGVIYLIAFISLWTQIDGLIGDHGILPVNNYLDSAQRAFAAQEPPASPYWSFPTLAWLSPHDGFLNALCAVGVVLSILVILGLIPLAALVLLWLDYLSLFHAGQDFLSFQWDILLLETGFVAIFLAPFTLRSKLFADRHPPRIAIWLTWWILFRLMLESGAVKLTWNQYQLGPDNLPIPNTWTSLTALDFHYWTQPLPMITSWYAAQLPHWFQEFSILFVFVVELILPWFIFGPRPLRAIASAGIIFLMFLIGGTGNYNFFNLLTVALALTLLDDKLWPDFLRRRITGPNLPMLASTTRWRSLLLIPFAALVIFLGARQAKQAILPARPEPSLESKWNISQFCLVNSYGLFRQMTETRPEIIIEGSADGENWTAYSFRWKPGDLSRPPRFNTPHQPRLDWQMWFEALRLEQVEKLVHSLDPRYADPWFQSFLMQLLKGEPKVLALLAENPFPDAPPKFVRISLNQYRFTTPAERRASGHWWSYEPVRVGPTLSLPH